MAWGCLWKQIAIDMQFVYHAMCIMKLKCLFSYDTPLHQILFPDFLIRNTQFSKTKLHMPFTYISKHLLPKIQEN